MKGQIGKCNACKWSPTDRRIGNLSTLFHQRLVFPEHVSSTFPALSLFVRCLVVRWLYICVHTKQCRYTGMWHPRLARIPQMPAWAPAWAPAWVQRGRLHLQSILARTRRWTLGCPQPLHWCSNAAPGLPGTGHCTSLARRAMTQPACRALLGASKRGRKNRTPAGTASGWRCLCRLGNRLTRARV